MYYIYLPYIISVNHQREIITNNPSFTSLCPKNSRKRRSLSWNLQMLPMSFIIHVQWCTLWWLLWCSMIYFLLWKKEPMSMIAAWLQLPIPKKVYRTYCDNYWTISLLESAFLGKFLLFFAESRLMIVRDNRMRPKQAGFRSKRGSVD